MPVRAKSLICLGALLYLAHALAVFGQEARVIVRGRVTNSVSGTGVSEALVELKEGSDRANTVARGTTRTDSGGAFAFPNVSAGRYWLRAQKPGFLGGRYGQAKPNDLGTFVDVGATDVALTNAIRLWPYGEVSGTVIDEERRPIEAGTVHLLRQVTEGGRSVLRDTRVTKTDASGSYVITGVMPGRYLLAVEDAVLRSDGVSSTTFYYPGADAPTEAVAIEVGVGDRRAAVDLSRPRVHRTDVRGRIVAPFELPSGTTVTLRQAGPGPRTSLGFMTLAVSPDGRFGSALVPAGLYEAQVIVWPSWPELSVGRKATDMVAKATRSEAALAPVPDQPTWWARQEISVNNSSVEPQSIVMPLTRGMSIRGRVTFRGQRGLPTTKQLLARAVHVSVVEGMELQGRFPAARIEADGGFRTPELPPGRYMLGLVPDAFPGWSVASILAGRRELMGRAFDLSEQIDDLDIVLTDRPNRLMGSVTNADRIAPEAIHVIAVSVDPSSWSEGTDLGGQVFRVPPHENLTFQLTGLPAGRYAVAAVTGPSVDAWRGDSVLRAVLSLGRVVNMTSDSQATMSVQLVTLR